MWEWLINQDFANYWIAAQLVISGQSADLFSDHASYFRHMIAAFGPEYPWHNWSYPPHYLLLIWPLGFMSYPVAMAVFLTVTLGLYLVAFREFLRNAGGRAGTLVLVIILLPFVADNILTAQNGFLTGALLLGGLAMRGSRPVLAGILFGILTIKPQLGLVLPFLLLIERQWRVILVAILTTLVLMAVSAILFGADSWSGYLNATLPYQKAVMMSFTGHFTTMMPGLFMMGRLAGLEAQHALWLHLLVAVPLFILALVAIRRAQSAGLRAAVMILATYIVAPYWLSYDYGAASAAIAFLIGQAAAGPAALRLVLLVAAFVPLLSVPLAQAGLLVTPLPVFAAFFIAVRFSLREGGPERRRV